MAKDASGALGAPEVAGTFVNPAGMARKMTAKVAGGVVGGVAGAAATGVAVGGSYDGVPDVPSFGRVAYVAASADEIAIVRTRTGAFRMKITDEVLARAPRSAIAGVELDKGVLSHLRIAFADGAVWAFDVPRANRRTAEALVRALTA
ncbi:MAG: hypothetical protein IRZ32_17370 [Solirubrobacteraceae bacterium]|nr:hypothetical protein [Solirubrobacteraceae bacterium]